MGTGPDVGLLISSGSATFYEATGKGWAFTQSGSPFTAPVGINAQLVQNGDGTYTLTYNASGEAYEFDSGGNLTAVQNRQGNQITFAYSGTKLGYITNTEGQQLKFAYSSTIPSTVLAMFGPGGHYEWKYAYDGNGNLSTITDPTSDVTTFGYDASHDLTQITDPNGNITLISYDSSGRVTEIVNVTNTTTNTGPTTTYTYNSGSTVVMDPNSHSTTYAYDSSGRVTSVTHPDSTVETLTWTSDNHVATDKLPSGAATTYTYDSLNNLTQVTAATGATAKAAYGDSSFPYLPTTITDAQGNTTTVGYSSQGLPTSVKDGNGKTTSISYNTDGTVASETDANNHTTSYTYTTTGLPYQIVPPSPLGTTTYAYNGVDLESSVTDGNGKLTTYAYDNTGRVTGIAYADNTSIGYSYDGDGNVLSMADGTGTTTYAYNALNEQISKTLPSGASVSCNGATVSVCYTYDNAGDMLTKQDSAGTITYGYNQDDELTSVKDRQSNAYTLGYDSNGATTSIAFPGGITESMTYNGAGQLTKIAGTGCTSGTCPSFTYSYTNPANNTATGIPYSVTDSSGNVATYTYDGDNQLTQAVQKNSSGTQLASYSYGYDPVGNMTSKNVNGTSTTFTFNAANELTQATGGISKTYSYDSNGQLTSESNGMTLTHNAAEQTTSITPPGGSAENMTYTGPGEAERTSAGSTTYQYDAAGASQQTTSGTTTTLTTLPDRTVLSEYVGGATYSYLTDGEGSVAGLASTTGALVDWYKYDPTGNVTSSQVQVSNPYTYQFGECDASTGFCRMGNGWLYDPEVGVCPNGATGIAQEVECGPGMALHAWQEIAPELAFENYLINNLDPPCPPGWKCKWVRHTWCSGFGRFCGVWHLTILAWIKYN